MGGPTDGRERDTRSGRYTEAVTPEEVLLVFAEREDPYEPLTAKEIAERLGFDRRTVDNKLRSLADRGDVATKKVGARARVWWTDESTVYTEVEELTDDQLFVGDALFTGGESFDVRTADDVIYGSSTDTNEDPTERANQSNADT